MGTDSGTGLGRETSPGRPRCCDVGVARPAAPPQAAAGAGVPVSTHEVPSSASRPEAAAAAAAAA
jgi:hypothetical protein